MSRARYKKATSLDMSVPHPHEQHQRMLRQTSFMYLVSHMSMGSEIKLPEIPVV